MRQKIIGYLLLFLVIFAITSGLFGCIAKVAIWLVTLDMSAPAISIAGQLVVKYGTWVITFSLVGAIFDFFGLFNSRLMSLLYVTISIVVSFALSWLVMLIEQYLLTIVIIVLALLCLSLAALILVRWYKKKKKNKAVEGIEGNNLQK